MVASSPRTCDGLADGCQGWRPGKPLGVQLSAYTTRQPTRWQCTPTPVAVACWVSTIWTCAAARCAQTWAPPGSARAPARRRTRLECEARCWAVRSNGHLGGCRRPPAKPGADGRALWEGIRVIRGAGCSAAVLPAPPHGAWSRNGRPGRGAGRGRLASGTVAHGNAAAHQVTYLFQRCTRAGATGAVQRRAPESALHAVCARGGAVAAAALGTRAGDTGRGPGASSDQHRRRSDAPQPRHRLPCCSPATWPSAETKRLPPRPEERQREDDGARRVQTPRAGGMPSRAPPRRGDQAPRVAEVAEGYLGVKVLLASRVPPAAAALLRTEVAAAQGHPGRPGVRPGSCRWGHR